MSGMSREYQDLIEVYNNINARVAINADAVVSAIACLIKASSDHNLAARFIDSANQSIASAPSPAFGSGRRRVLDEIIKHLG